MNLFQRTFKSQVGLRIAIATILACLCIPCSLVLSSQLSIADDAGSIDLAYESALPQLSTSNTAYMLSDARFGVYSDYQCTQLVAEIVTDESGHGGLGALSAGRYFIRQLQASPGFALSDHLYQVDVPVGSSAHVDASSSPNYAAPSIILNEFNGETGQQSCVAGSTLKGARFVISYYEDDQAGTILSGPSRTWTFESDAHGQVRLSDEYLVDGSPLFKSSQNIPVLPLGHYIAYMEKAPTGYLENGSSHVCDIADVSNAEIDPICAFDPFNIDLQVIRGDVAFRKVDENLKPQAGIPFLLSYANEDGESSKEAHVVVTDENGDFSSDSARIAHSFKTNESDAAVTPLPKDLFALDESKLVAHAGTWFSMDSGKVSTEPEDELGALPYGTYTLQELPCSANEGMNLSTVQFSIFRNGFTSTLGNIVGTTPAVNVLVFDSTDQDRLIRPEKDAMITATVSYRNLVPGKRYEFTCCAVTKDSGETLTSSGGAPASQTLELVPKSKDGRLQVQISLDTSKLAGRQVFVTGELISEDGMNIPLAGLDEGSQLLDVEPIIHASAFDSMDEDKYVMGLDAVVVEHIEFEGLVPGKTYEAKATLNDRATESALRDAQGRVIESVCEFVPEASEGFIDIELPVDTTGIAGHDLVVFDKLGDESGALIASHQDIDDPDQTVKTVKLTTSAADKEDGDKVFNAQSHGVTIVDTVKYANLTPGEQYELHGVLMDKETGSALSVNGTPVTARMPFVPKEVSGSIDVEFTFDAYEQTSEVLVAFETLIHEGKVIAEHVDLEDVAQTVTSEDVDPESIASSDAGQVLGASTSGKGPKTGDMIPRALGLVLITLALAALGIAYAAHRRKRTLEAISRSCEIKR